MAAEPGLTLTIYTAEPASSSEEDLRLLASWAATEEAVSIGAALRATELVHRDTPPASRLAAAAAHGADLTWT
jgi:hypothetical protein